MNDYNFSPYRAEGTGITMEVSAGNLVKFCYDNGNEYRYVEVLKVSGANFDGADWSKKTDTDSGYRSFKFDKIVPGSLKTLCSPDEVCLPNTQMTASVLLECIGIRGNFRYNQDENVIIINKSAFLK